MTIFIHHACMEVSVCYLFVEMFIYVFRTTSECF